MTEPGSARRAVTGEAAEAMRDAILDEIQEAVLDRMADAGGTLPLIARAGSVITGALSVLGEVQNIYDMALAGYEAMTTQRRMVQRVAGAHAFGYWVYQNPGTHPPKNMPYSYARDMRESDYADARIGRRSGNLDFSSDGGISAAEWQNIWRSAVQNMIIGLNRDLQERATRGTIMPELREALGAAAQIDNQTPQQQGNLFRVAVIGAKFRRRPSLAARTFLLGSLNDANHLEREMTLRLYARIPYDPPR